jgi:hypothetical protein
VEVKEFGFKTWPLYILKKVRDTCFNGGWLDPTAGLKASAWN